MDSGEYRPQPARHISAGAAAIVMIVVVVVLGAGAYVAFNGATRPVQSYTTCQPVTNFNCARTITTDDMSLLAPLRTTQQGNPLPFTASLPGGAPVTLYTFNFGDGNESNSTVATVDHAYAYPGLYIVSVTAIVNGVVHNSYPRLIAVTVTTSYAATSSGDLPGVSGGIVNNSTSSTHPTAVIASGDHVSLQGSYTTEPTNPAWTTGTPTLVAPGGTVTNLATSAAGASATVSFSTSGPHTAAFVGVSNGPAGAVAHQEFIWTVFVAPTGVPTGLTGTAVHKTPHPGTIIAYENTPGGTYTSDPAIDYDIVGFEILINVYQTLVFYNETQTGASASSFTPQLATCVPGSPLCQQLYGSTLVNGTDYTFVVSHAANFYDPATQKSWGVWPTDVLFSVARTMAFAVLPCVGCNNGWILSQSLLSPGNSLWDSGFHGAYNNTPANVFASVTLNESKYCTATMMSNDHGCVTFHANGSGLNWPYFLQLVGDGEGASVVPCGWFSAPAQGAGIPYWTAGNVSGSGDHPCGAPGTPGWGAPVSSIPVTGWDAWEVAGSNSPFVGNVQYNMVGSGPYYMSDYRPGFSFTLKQNPAYAANPNCVGIACQPKPGQFAGTVEVIWETSPTIGEEAMSAGIADYAGIPSTDFALLLQLIEAGQANVLSIPTINIYFLPFVLYFNLAGTQSYTSNPITVPPDWFSYLGMRQFFVHSYPYATAQASVNTKDGIQVGFPFGGAIPQFMGNYYPKDIAWPTGDPCDPNAAASATNSSCATYWWNQITTSGSPYYDPEAAACTTSNPCQLPIFGVSGDPDTDARLALWVSELSTLSGGKVKGSIIDILEASIVVGQYAAPKSNFLDVYSIRWVPDYPDPTDYVRPLYYPDTVYTYSSAVAEMLSVSPFNSSTGCPGGPTDYNTYANLTTPVANSCQGNAYWAMNQALALAGPLPAGPQRIMLYDLAERIANQLALYVYNFQQNLVPALGPWVDPGSFNANPVIGAGGDTPWFWITGNDVAAVGAT